MRLFFCLSRNYTTIVDVWLYHILATNGGRGTKPQRRSSRPPNPPIGGGPGQLWGPKLV